MSLPDSAEYWWDVKGKNGNRPKETPAEYAERKERVKKNQDRLASIPEHKCYPRYPEGTPYRWKCPVCDRKISKRKFKMAIK